MQRREFLKLGATLSAVTLLPSWSRFAFAQSNTPSLAIPPMKKMFALFCTLTFSFTLIFSSSTKALTYTQAEDLADLTAIYLFLNKDCGYEQKER